MNPSISDSASKPQKWSGEEIGRHNTSQDCWVIIHGRAYDVTEFKADHPGGSKIIEKFAGKDATETYDPIHPPDTLDKYLPKDKHMGEVNMQTVEIEHEHDPEEENRLERVKRMPELEQCYNLMDFEAVARRIMKRTAWAYYSSGADDEIVSLPKSLDPFPLPQCAPLESTHTDSLRNRQCARTTRPTTKSGSGHGYYKTSNTSTHQHTCSAHRSQSPST